MLQVEQPSSQPRMDILVGPPKRALEASGRCLDLKSTGGFEARDAGDLCSRKCPLQQHVWAGLYRLD